MLNKLCALGIGDLLLSWFGSYLTGMTKKNKIVDQLSYFFSVHMGVSQDRYTCIYPLLFLLFVNYRKNEFCFFKYSLFADDLKL
jgi:hypothetical protein